MKSNLLKCVAGGAILASVVLLSACNTVEGTVNGAGKDIKAVANAVDNGNTTTHKHKHHKKHMATTKTTTTTTNTAAPANTTEQTPPANSKQ